MQLLISLAILCVLSAGAIMTGFGVSFLIIHVMKIQLHSRDINSDLKGAFHANSRSA